MTNILLSIRILFSLFIALFLLSCGGDDEGSSNDPCDLYKRTLTGSFVSDDDPDLTLSFAGDGLSGMGTASHPNRTDMCTYRVENCVTGDIIGTCNGRSEFGTIRVIDTDHIVVNNMFIENFLRGDRGFTRR